MTPLNFIPWILVVQLNGLPDMKIPFDAFGPFNSARCVEYEIKFREHGLAAECEPVS